MLITVIKPKLKDLTWQQCCYCCKLHRNDTIIKVVLFL